MKRLKNRLFKLTKGTSIQDVKKRLIFMFSVLALSSCFFVFFSFSLYLVFNEDAKLEQYIASFESIAIDHYQLSEADEVNLGSYVRAYYSTKVLNQEVIQALPLPEGKVSRFRMFEKDGFMIFHATFLDKDGNTVPLFLKINHRAVDFGDDHWEALMLIAFGLMAFLIAFLRFSLRRVFDSLMSPVLQLSEQLKTNREGDFSVSEQSIDELKQLTDHINRYKKMRERLSKQEMMFAKYASHELKTPIAVVLGAANLQAMKDDAAFQAKQRERILIAANNMQSTVEVLLSIVKQENVQDKNELHDVELGTLHLDKYRRKLSSALTIECVIEAGCQINMPPAVLGMIIKNLLNNAIRFTEEGYIQISIDPNCIQVLDTGKGLTDKPDTEHGLGLLIVKRLCDSYGWVFDLSNNPDGGCRARLTF